MTVDVTTQTDIAAPLAAVAAFASEPDNACHRTFKCGH